MQYFWICFLLPFTSVVLCSSSNSSSASLSSLVSEEASLPHTLEEVTELRRQFPDDDEFFKVIFNFLQKNEVFSLNPTVKLCLLLNFIHISKQKPVLHNQLDFSQLPRTILNSIFGLAVKEENFALFRFLVESRILNLNADYKYAGFKGNAVVFVAEKMGFFYFSVLSGMDLKRPVIDGAGNSIAAMNYYLSLQQIKEESTEQ